MDQQAHEATIPFKGFEINASEKLIWFWLKPQGIVAASRETIAEALGLPIRTIRKDIQQLFRLGLLKQVAPRSHREGTWGSLPRVMMAVGDYVVLPLPPLPREVKKLPPGPKLVWLYLANLEARLDGPITVLASEIAKELGLNLWTAKEALRQLRRINAIQT